MKQKSARGYAEEKAEYQYLGTLGNVLVPERSRFS